MDEDCLCAGVLVETETQARRALRSFPYPPSSQLHTTPWITNVSASIYGNS